MLNKKMDYDIYNYHFTTENEVHWKIRETTKMTF